ncbi:Protein PHTF1 [Trichinella pseudospiralis]
MLHKQKTYFIDLKTSTLAVVGLRCAVAEQCDFLVEIWMSIYEKSRSEIIWSSMTRRRLFREVAFIVE